MAGIVEGLFGMAPYQAEQQAIQGLNADAYRFAQLDPLAQATMGMYKAGGMLAGGVAPAFGLENPAVREAKMREQALSGLDPSNPQSILERAAQIQDPRMKMQLTLLGRQMLAEQQKQAIEQQKMALQERKQEFQENDAFELRKMEAEARIRQNDERIADTRTTNAEKIQLQRENNQIKLLLGQMANAVAQQRSGSSAPKGLSREARLKYELDNGLIDQATYDAAMEATPGGKLKAKEQLRAESMDAVKNKIDLTVSAVDDAIKNTGFFTTGATGKILSAIPGTSAFDLEGTVNTILANLGFNELQQMRNASPTGGALGQVAVRELEMLQSTIASLRMGQSKDKQLQSLAAIKKHLTNWQDAVNKSGTPSPTENKPSGGWSIRPKGQ